MPETFGVAGPDPSRARPCQFCRPVGVFGFASVRNARYLGGVVWNGGRIDPLRHADDCPGPRMAVPRA